MAPRAQTIDISEWQQKRHTSDLDKLHAADLREAFRNNLPLPAHTEPHLQAALRHLLDHPGSMVRPRTVMQMALAYDIDPQAAMALAVALEYFHTASIVFDDLPCMDDGVSRRGVPCVHVPFGDAAAILAALALVNRAYALTWKAIAAAPESARPLASDYLEARLGVHGLLNGQSLDLNYFGMPHNRETVDRVASGKTASLIRLTLVLPAIIGVASKHEIRHLERIATCWGLAYQILDDLKDVLQSSAESGKSSARDLQLDRPNVALVLGVPAAMQRLTRLVEIGNRALARAVADRPALQFLVRLRADLEQELDRVTDRALTAAQLA